MLHIHQYSVHILYKSGPKLFIANWYIRDIPVCTYIEDIKAAAKEDAELQMPKMYIIDRWPHSRKVVEPGAEKYWPIRH